MLRESTRLVGARGLEVMNVDVTVILERPKIAPYLEPIRSQLSAAIATPVDRISVKGKTNEGVDAVGRGEAVAAHAVALLQAQ
jgi:2-C-methyl-D-erythritol 2,4-cyclodiphosphate synthase